jgi:hypothetical protein
MKKQLRRYLRHTGGLIALAAVSGCPFGTQTQTTVPSGAQPTVNPGRGGGTPLVAPQDSLCSRADAQLAQDRGLDTNAVNFAMANGYYGWCIPEYDDDQRLSDGNGADEYGAIAHVLAAPWLDTLQFNGSFRQVAIIEVDPEADPTPAPYTDLRLGRFNCLYLRLASTEPSFDAVIVPPDGTLKCPTTPTPPPGPPLVVVVDAPFSNDLADYPPTTRFIEGRNGRTLVGVRCGDRWCAVGPRRAIETGAPGGPVGPLPPSAHQGLAGFNNAQGRVKGWFDDQMLGVPDAAPRHRIHRRVRASAVPDAGLRALTVNQFIVPIGTQQYQIVGRTYFPEPPDRESKYVKVFGFSQGTNTVGMRAEIKTNPLTSKPDTVWFTQVINGNGQITNDIKTRRMDHRRFLTLALGERTKIPATMRWRWLDKDEDLWVECDVGCCLAGIR